MTKSRRSSLETPDHGTLPHGNQGSQASSQGLVWRAALAAAWLLLALVVTGCGDTMSLSPVGPSPVVEAASAPSSDVLAGWATSRGWSTFADGRVAVADGLLVEAVDTIASVSGKCPAPTVWVRGVPVAVTATTRLSGFSCESLAPGLTVKVTGLLSYAGGGFSVTATQLAMVGSADTRGGNEGRGEQRAGGEGVIGAITGACPSLTLVITGYHVETAADTVYEGGACETLREGTQVRVEVLKQADGRMIAERIAITRVPGRRE